MKYCAIIGDIVGSRTLPNRASVQVRFKKAIDQINKKYRRFIASSFTVTLGDEFQGLLYDPSASYGIIKSMKEEILPVELVFGVGIGEMTTGFDESISIGSDGPAYHYARQMVMRAKKKKPSICYFSASPEDGIINALVYFIESCTNKQTARQREVIKLYEQGFSQERIAKQLGIKQPSVSNIIDKGFYHEIKNAEEQIVDFLRSRYNCPDNNQG